MCLLHETYVGNISQNKSGTCGDEFSGKFGLRMSMTLPVTGCFEGNKMALRFSTTIIILEI